MTPQTCERAPVTNGTSLFIPSVILPIVRVKKIWRVIGGFNGSFGIVALFATKRSVNLGMANKAVSHGRKRSFRD